MGEDKLLIDGVAVPVKINTALKDRGIISMVDIKSRCIVIPINSTVKNNVCRCSAYHFPHREGGGRCGKLDMQLLNEMQKRIEQEIFKSLMIPAELLEPDSSSQDSIHQLVKRSTP